MIAKLIMLKAKIWDRAGKVWLCTWMAGATFFFWPIEW